MSTLASLLFVLFLGLKLAGVIAWSWIWIFSPLWIGGALFLLLLIIGFLLKLL